MADETPEQRRERWRSITIGGRRPGGSRSNPDAIRPMQQPKWEGTKVYDERPGGFKVPLVHDSNPTQPVTAKQYQNRRGHYDEYRKRLRNDPNIFNNART